MELDLLLKSVSLLWPMSSRQEGAKDSANLERMIRNLF